MDNLEILLTMVESSAGTTRGSSSRWPMFEENVGRASNLHWVDRQVALGHLKRAAEIVEVFIADRKAVMKNLVVG